jgi:hypothetical protein
VVWHLLYDDQYQRTDADWRICSRALTIDAIEIRPARQVRFAEPSGSADMVGADQPSRA